MKELIYQNQSEIFEKLVCTLDGRFFRVRFVVVERNGTLRGKVISCEQIPAIQTNRIRRSYSPFVKGSTRQGEGFYLPARRFRQAVEDKGLRIKDLYFSPYFNKFEFLTCIKIRAPSGVNS